MQYYTNVFQSKGKIYSRGIDHNGQQTQEIVRYKPYLFVKSNNPSSEYKNIHEEPVDRMDFDSIWEAKEFLKEYKDVRGFPIYGLTKWQYMYIYDNFKGDIKFNSQDISVVGLDIEWRIGPKDIATTISTSCEPITAITISRNGYFDSFGYGDYDPKENETYHKCSDEADLLRSFIRVWKSTKYNPDIITGWNVEGADIPYLVGRIIRILGDEEACELSPWGMLEPYTIQVKGKELNSWNIRGITVLDYLPLYKKFVLKPRESFSLDYISEVELDEKKLDYREQGYMTLNELEVQNHPLFMSYNIRDVDLVNRLEDKLKLIELVLTMSYDSGINYIDTLGTVGQWDVILHNFLLDENTVTSPQVRSSFSDFVGGYVKDPTPGLYKWVVSFDIDSLYPHLYIMFNISPDTFVQRLSTFPSIDQLLEGAKVPDNGYSITANGCCYRKDKQGFIPRLVKVLYSDRKKFKGMMIEAEKKVNDGDLSFENEVSRLHNIQHSKKIKLNALYGATGNINFRYFDINSAEAITTSGQLAIRWIADRVNIQINKFCKTKDVEYLVMSDTDSVLGDTIIEINGEKLTISDFFERTTGKFLKKDDFNEDYVKQVLNSSSPSVNSSGDLEYHPVRYVMKHKVRKRMFRITVGEKQITVTEDHSIIVRNKKTKKISSIKPAKLNTKFHEVINISVTDTDTGITDGKITKDI